MVSQESLQQIIGMAITDWAFREALLCCPLAAVEGFDLSDEERAVVASIRAKSLDQFAARLELWRSRLPIKGDKRRNHSPWTNELLRNTG